MTATNLGLNGSPQVFLSGYIINVSSSLGLAQSPGTCSVSLVEDPDEGYVFEEPTLGGYYEVRVGNNFNFGGVVTRWDTDVRNIGGRQITVNLSDVREIMKSVPIILAPGYRQLVTQLVGTNVSFIDAFGAYDDYVTTGINLSGWNQAGMTFDRLALVFKGGAITYGTTTFNVAGQAANLFGNYYRFNLDEIANVVDTEYRINTNLISIADLIQELATRHSFDWYVETERNAVDNYIDVTIRIVDRSTDNVDISFDDFLAAHSGYVVRASRGYELRNETACVALYGSLVEQMMSVGIEGLANNPIDLSTEGGSDKYFMTEEEMRFVLADKESWRAWVTLNGGAGRYSVGGAGTIYSRFSPGDASDVANQIGVNPNRFSIITANEAIWGKVYDKLKGHAESTYGKRFKIPSLIDVDFIDAAWTADTIAGNNDPNEYFRNSAGKTRCYVKFIPGSLVTSTLATIAPPSAGVLGFAGNYGFGLGDKAPQALSMELVDQFNFDTAITEADKSDWIIDNNNLYVAATIEEGGVVRIDNPVIYYLPDSAAGVATIGSSLPSGTQSVAEGEFDRAKVVNIRRAYANGSKDWVTVHGKCYQPNVVYIPVRSKFTRYGPVVSSNLTTIEGGKLVIENDDGFSPWEFGSSSLMTEAMQFKVENASSSVKDVESGNVEIEGFPRYSIGESIGINSNINSINISMGGQVTTTYEFRSFLRQFGELSKEELAYISMFARRGGGRVFPQDMVGYINRYLPTIYKQFSGKGGMSSSAKTGGADSFE